MLAIGVYAGLVLTLAMIAVLLIRAYNEFELYDRAMVILILACGFLAFGFDSYIAYSLRFLEPHETRLQDLVDHILFRDGLETMLDYGPFGLDPRILYHGAWILGLTAWVGGWLRRRAERRRGGLRETADRQEGRIDPT